ncbi:uncharacterized protein LOC121638002 isoform X2 [Melanotaenia boesemani]|uniref:uncharacterized protein LOC121638002 isoform X2 n=1 Tax=Melanotaenia boesemani TaxID=1250792 RepID=UPI001C05EBF1|nr:uncharacterized protein LOC121638002 isoform X2 [Melanotaenia boesemani]
MFAFTYACVIVAYMPHVHQLLFLYTPKTIFPNLKMSDPKEDELRSAAISLIEMLRRTLNNPAPIEGQPTQQAARDSSQETSQRPPPQRSITVPVQGPSGSTVQQSMARSFPGLFNKRTNLRPHLRSTKKRPSSKMTPVQFCLLQTALEKTPKLTEELMLLQAGLGRRTVNIPEDAGHKEVADLLCEVFPKLNQVEGAWMLYKAMGGSGQRKLIILPPEDEGYTGSSILKTLGKSCLYIMPIQHTLDITPLPMTAPEFQAMPKARCLSCQNYVPLQLLGLHVKECNIFNGSDETAPADDTTMCEDDDVQLLQVLTEMQPEVLESKVACPLCGQLFNKEDICTHASFCGESNRAEEDVTVCEDVRGNYSSVSDILIALEKRVDTSVTFNISVTREDLFQRGMKQWIRQKKASPKNLLRVSFIGEHGIDEGALRKEFLTEMVRGIESHYFEGDGEQGKIPKYNILDYQDHNFKTCGEILATSLVQGGPAPNFFTTQCYNFLCHGEMGINGGPEEVTAQDMKNLKAEVQNADDEKLMGLSDAIVACGYQGPITVDKKNAITEAIGLHSVVRLIPILTQLREGFKLYGVTEILAHHEQLCQELFVPGHITKMETMK